MTSSISTYLPSAFAVALSPMMIIAMIVFCVIGKARTSGTAFLLGAFLGMAAFMLLGATIAASFQPESGDTALWQVLLRLAMAIFLLYLSWHSWKTRPKSGTTPSQPSWIGKIQNANLSVVCLFGAMIMVINAKNMMILLHSALNIQQLSRSWGEIWVNFAIFWFIALLGIGLPWAMSILGGAAVETRLHSMRDWLYRNNNVILAILFGFFGLQILAQALGY